jgi:hypothetical protein
MPRYQIAHLHEQGQDLIIVPLDPIFGIKSSFEQQRTMTELQARSLAAGLRGIVAVVWESGGRMSFLAPRRWHAYFQSITFAFIQINLNREIYW